MEILQNMDKILNDGLEQIANAKTVEEVQDIRRELTGKKSPLSEVSKSMGSLDADIRKQVGMKVGEIKNTFATKLDEKEQELISLKSVLDEPLDLTLPGSKVSGGALHPITQMCYDLNDAFISLGFEVFSEDDISSEKYAFDNLNFADDHPARQSMDTYWIEGTDEKSGIRFEP